MNISVWIVPAVLAAAAVFLWAAAWLEARLAPPDDRTEPRPLRVVGAAFSGKGAGLDLVGLGSQLNAEPEPPAA